MADTTTVSYSGGAAASRRQRFSLGVGLPVAQRDSNAAREKYSKALISLVFLFFVLRFIGPVGKLIVDGVGGYVLQAAIVLLCFIMAVNSELRVRDFFLALGFVFISIASTALVGGGWGSVFNNIFAALILLFLFAVTYSESSISLFYKLMRTFFVVFVVAMFVVGKSGGYFWIYNANTVGVVTLTCIVVINCYGGNGAGRVALNILAAAMIFYADSRTALVAYIISIVFLIGSVKVKRRAAYLVFFWLIVAIGLAMPYLYSNFYLNQSGALFSTIQAFSIEYFNKNIFTGREAIWSAAIGQLGDTPLNILIGIGSHFSGEEGSYGGNFHNSYFTILICTGILGSALFFALLRNSFAKVFGDGNAHSRRACAAFLSLMVLGIAESVLFSGYTGAAIFLVLALGLGKDTALSDGAKTHDSEDQEYLKSSAEVP